MMDLILAALAKACSTSNKLNTFIQNGDYVYVEKGVLTVTGTIINNTVIVTHTSGVNIEKSVDTINLGPNAEEFNDSKITFLYDGILLQNGTDVIYVTSYSFLLPNITMDDTDQIIILK